MLKMRLFISFWLLVALNTAAYAQALFGPPTHYPTGFSLSVFSVDLDGDGDNDLAVIHDSYVSVLLNNGNGTFAPKVDYLTGDPPGEGPSSVFSVDLDGDGDNDLAVANETGNNVSVLLNNGDGTFAPKVGYIAGSRPRSVFSVDLDGDGDNDLAAANMGDPPEWIGSVSVLLNNGNGIFVSKVDYAVGDGPRSVFSMDLDGDGDNDLAAANMGDPPEWIGSVSVLLNNGNGIFVSKVDYAVGDGPRSVFSMDLDGDGDNDLAVANQFSDNVSVLLNNGDGTFADKVGYGVGAWPFSVFIADLDGDADNDLAVGNGGGRTVSVLLNRSIMPPPPVVTSIDPVSGLKLEATPVTIAGNNFQTGTSVTFRDSVASDLVVVRDSPATNVVVVSDTIITAITPHHPAGTVDVIVANPDGLADTLFSGFRFINPGPNITDVSVSRGVVPLADPVVIFVNLTDADGVDSVYVRVWDRDDTTFPPVHLALFDDGVHDDGALGDGQWGSDPWFTPDDHPRFFYVDIWAIDNLGAESHMDSVAQFETADPTIFVTVGMGEEIAGPGGQALVPIFAHVLDDKDVVSGEILMRFDPNLAQLIQAFPGPGRHFPSGFDFNSPEPGKAITVFASTTPLSDTPEGTLAFAVFQVNSSAPLGSRINVSVNQANLNEGFPPVTSFDGTITVELVGDVSRNGEIRAFDASLALMWSVTTRNIPVEFFGGDADLFLAISDVTRNGEVGAFDAVRILQFLVSKIPGLPYLGPDGLAKVAEIEPRAVSISEGLETSERGIKVSVSIDDMSGVLGADISISYDASKLKAVGVSPSDMMSPFMFQSNIEVDEVKMAAASAEGVEGEGDIAYIEFEILPGESHDWGDAVLRIQDVQLNEGLIPAVTEQTELSLAVIPEVYALSQNYPNPFNPETVIHYDLPFPSHVKLSVYNIMGQKVATLVDGERSAGSHSIVWDGKNNKGESLASGVYLYRMETEGFVQTRKLVLMR